MFLSLLSGLRLYLVSFLCFISLSHARELSLFTSSVTYCEPPEAILIQYFDVAYLARNNSVFFNISAESVQGSFNVSANIMLNVYGMNPLNVTIDLCDILDGVLCPLPRYYFNGSQTLQLPSSVDTSQVPGIAYHVPDLEGFAQLILTDNASGEIRACAQATLSNGWSMHQPAVSWATGAFTFVTLLLSIWESSSPYAILPFRLMDLLHMFQSIAATAFLRLNYPSAYRQFAINFAWAVGFITSSSAQSSIDNMRALTGGALANSTSSSAVERVNRKLSPYNVETASSNIVSFLLGDMPRSLAPRALFGEADGAPTLDESSSNVQTVTPDSTNVLQAGIPIYVNSVNVGSANAFMTMFFTLLVLAAIYLAVWLGATCFSVMQRRSSRQPQGMLKRFPAFYRPFLASWGIRLLMIVWFPVMIFTMFQWTLKDSWLSLLFSIFTFLVILTGMAVPWFILLRSVRQSTREVLFSDHLLSKFSPLYSNFRIERFYFGGITIASYFIKALIISAAQNHGKVQIGLYLTLEIILLALSVGLKPTSTRGGDIFSSFLMVIRVVCSGLLISFLEDLKVSAIPRVIIGLVMAVVFSVAILVTIVNIVIHIVRRIRQGRLSHSEQRDPSPETLENGASPPSDGSVGEQEVDLDRPYNPTPDHNVYLDPEVNQPYPSVTPTTTGRSRKTSGSTTLGSVLPSRWSSSFSPAHSTRPSPSSDTFSAFASHGHSTTQVQDQS